MSRRLVFSADVVARLRARDELAYRELFEQAWTPLTAIAVAIVQSHDVAQDVVQGVMIRLWNQAEHLTLHGELSDYLVVAVRNAALTALRNDGRLRDRKERMTATQSETILPHALPADAGLEWADEMTKLRHVFGTLTEHQRTAFVLRYGQGMTNAEIARVLGISLKGAEQLTARVTKIVRERFLDPPV